MDDTFKVLTRRQKRVYDLLVKNAGPDGRCNITIRSMIKALGFSSLNAVAYHLIALERKGFIERAKGKRWGTRIVRWNSERCPHCGGTGRIKT